MKNILFFALLFSFSLLSPAQTDEIETFRTWALTPPMGWNSWDCYYSSVNEDIFLANDGSCRKVKQQVKVSLTRNVADKVAFKSGDYILIKQPQYVVAGSGSSKFQNINASFIDIIPPEEVRKRNGIVN